jgi:hypothetical protein
MIDDEDNGGLMAEREERLVLLVALKLDKPTNST